MRKSSDEFEKDSVGIKNEWSNIGTVFSFAYWLWACRLLKDYYIPTADAGMSLKHKHISVTVISKNEVLFYIISNIRPSPVSRHKCP